MLWRTLNGEWTNLVHPGYTPGWLFNNLQNHSSYSIWNIKVYHISYHTSYSIIIYHIISYITLHHIISHIYVIYHTYYIIFYIISYIILNYFQKFKYYLTYSLLLSEEVSNGVHTLKVYLLTRLVRLIKDEENIV